MSYSYTGSCEREEDIFKKEVRVTVVRDGRENVKQLRLRVFYSRRSSFRVLQLELTDKEDPFFFYSAKVAEDEFVQIKNDQRLRVTFDTFPGHICNLLQRCSQPGGINTRLELSEGLSLLSLVEVNEFRELIHLCLRFRSGDEATVKDHISRRFLQILGDSASLRSRLEDSENRASSIALELSVLKQTRERDLQELRSSYASDLRELNLKLSTAEDKCKDYSELVKKLEQKLSESTQRAEHAGRQVDARLAELSALQAESKKLKMDSCRQMKELRHLLRRKDALKQEVFEAEKQQENLISLLKESESRRSKLKKENKNYRAHIHELQEKFVLQNQEIEQGNNSIERYHEEYKKLKLAIARKNKVILMQEEAVLNKEKLESSYENAMRQINQVRTELDSAQKQLKENMKLLEARNHTIQILNSELSRAQENFVPDTRQFYSTSWKTPSRTIPTTVTPEQCYEPVASESERLNAYFSGGTIRVS